MTYIELGDICDISKGEIGITKAIPGEYPMVTTGAERKSHNAFQLDTEAVLVPLVSATGHGHASIKRIHFQEGKFAFGSILAACVPKNNKYSAKFLYIYFQLMKDYILVPLMKGSANVSLTLGNLKTAKVPNISREMQESIVKLYSTLKIEQDEVTGILSNQKSDIDSLRQAILQEAVQGKLTAKWRKNNSNIESASVLLEKIKAEKKELIKSKKVKKSKPLDVISDDEKYFQIPETWIWERLGNIGNIFNGDSVNKAVKEVKYTGLNEGYPYIATKDVGYGFESINDRNGVKIPHDEPKFKIAHKGTVIICSEGGSAGKKMGMLPQDCCFGNKLYAIEQFGEIKSVYILGLYGSPAFSAAFQEKMSGIIGGISRSNFVDLLIPLPPLEEQQAIVEKVNLLMALCDELEQEVDNSQTQIEQLMQSCLKEVFEQESN